MPDYNYRQRPTTDAYRDNYDRIFKPRARALGLCAKCDGVLQPSKAIENTLVPGAPDFLGDHAGAGAVVTMSAGGPGNLIDCLKCPQCGWSVTT